MNEQEVWVRMMAAALAHGGPVETVAAWTDLAVAEWRKRYGAKAEPAPAPFKVGDRVTHLDLARHGEVVAVGETCCSVAWDAGNTRTVEHIHLSLDPTPPQR